MQLQVIKDKILIRPIHEPATSKLGVWLPPEARHRSYKAQVVAIGPDAIIATFGVVVGDVVLFHAHRGQELTVEDDFLLVVTADDLFAVYEKEDAEQEEE